MRLPRSLISWLPESAVMRLRRLRDRPRELRGHPHETDFVAFRHLDRPPAVVLDIGANRGQSIDSLRLCGGAGHIHSFEPNPVLVAELERRFGGDDTVSIHPVGLGTAEGSFELFVPRYGKVRFDTRSSTDREQAESFLAPEHIRPFSAARAAVEELTVSITTLDSFELTPDVVKIDVEGRAHDVVLGGRGLLERHQPIVLVEEPDDATSAELEGLGYRPFRWTGSTFVDGHGELNTFFLTDAGRARFTV